jgi:hypothetical protein
VHFIIPGKGKFMSESITIKVEFMDGNVWEYEVPLGQVDAAGIGELLTRINENQNMAFEADGQLVVIPLHNVRSFVAYPFPDVAPKGFIRGAKLKT